MMNLNDFVGILISVTRWEFLLPGISNLFVIKNDNSLYRQNYIQSVFQRIASYIYGY